MNLIGPIIIGIAVAVIAAILAPAITRFCEGNFAKRWCQGIGLIIKILFSSFVSLFIAILAAQLVFFLIQIFKLAINTSITVLIRGIVMVLLCPPILIEFFDRLNEHNDNNVKTLSDGEGGPKT